MQSLSTSEIDSAAISRIAENERHFHTIQAGIRGLASTWVLAAFAGIAALLRHEELIRKLQPFSLVIVICLMVNFGLSVLWIIDQLVYQRLFNTNYMAGLFLEQQFSLIPPVRAIQAITTRGRSIASWVKFFYAGPMLAFALIALVAAVVPNMGCPINLNGTAMVMGALLSLTPLAWVVYHAREVSFFRLAALLPGNFATILKEDNCRAIIVRHLQTLDAASAKSEVKSAG
jgi:hypothetical protein